MTAPIVTGRLTLVPATEQLIGAELGERAKLAAQLRADVPHDWPPPLSDEKAFRFLLDKLREAPGDADWWLRYVLRSHDDGGLPTVVGVCGFQGPPTDDGIVEIGYSVVPKFQRQGYATQACGALIDWALARETVSKVIGHTLVGLTASIRVMEKLGFRYEGEGPQAKAPSSEDRVIRYGLSREQYQEQQGNPVR